MSKVAPERTGWRDIGLSSRHRDYYGFNCPAVDVDFLLLEYDRGVPAALVEYKHEYVFRIKPDHPSYQALTSLADASGIPCFVTRYARDYRWYEPRPLNDRARELRPMAKRMTEKQWVGLLYRIRGREMPYDIASKLHGEE